MNKTGLTHTSLQEMKQLDLSDINNFKKSKPKLTDDFAKKVVGFAEKKELSVAAGSDDESEEDESEEDESEEEQPKRASRKRARET